MSVKTTNVRNVLVLLAIAGTLLVAPALIFSTQSARAQQSSFVEGNGEGQITCPSGTPEQGYPEEIIFSAERNKGDLSGHWTIFTDDPTGEGLAHKQGYFTSGKISGKQFTLRGIETIDWLCEAPAPTTIIFTGQCGEAVPIQFKASNGETGEFVGNVACAK